MPGRKAVDRADIDELGSVGDRGLELPWRQPAKQGRVVAVDGRATPVHLAEPEEVVGVSPEPGHQALDEGVLVGRGEQRVRRPLTADRRRPLAARRRRAERARAVRRVDREVVGQSQDPLVQRSTQLAGEGLGLVGR